MDWKCCGYHHHFILTVEVEKLQLNGYQLYTIFVEKINYQNEIQPHKM